MRAIDRLEKRIEESIAAAAAEPAREPVVCPGCGESFRWLEDFGLCESCASDKRREVELAARRANWLRSLQTLGVPRAYWSVPAAVDLPPQCAAWNGDPWCVTVLGPTGAGKTWVSIRVLMELYCKGEDGCLFVDAPTALDKIKAEMGSSDESINRGLFGRLVAAPALLVDDVSAARDTDYQRDRLVLLLRERYNGQRPTIITSNKASLAELAESLDGPICSRLASGIVIAVKGKDRRLA